MKKQLMSLNRYIREYTDADDEHLNLSHDGIKDR